MRGLIIALSLASGTAIAGPEQVKERLQLYEAESRALSANLPRPNRMSTQTGQRRLVDAQVMFSVGDYDGASLVLFDLVGRTAGQDKEIATYYLAESLYNKGDRGAARVYFAELAKTPSTKYYEPALLRIVEIAIVERDTASGDEALGKLNTSGPGITYVRGKWAFAQAQMATDANVAARKYDEALGLFNSVQRGSEFDAQATYYAGATYIAKKDLAKATEIFTELTTRKPKSNHDRRVIELAQLALGRVYYEREQPSKSIDSYLLVDRQSDLFPAALYEVSWVYVKSKQYDKALVALELLGKLDPESTQTPTVKILEGNLRIRKAQLIRQHQIAGTLSADERSQPAAEYTKADKLFEDVHKQYRPAYDALGRMVKGTLNPASFIDQISGRNTRVFTSNATPIPEAAAQWLREEPEVQRVVAVERDLSQVSDHIRESEAAIERLQSALATGDRLTLYPALSARRMRIAAIQHDLVTIRNQLAEDAIRAGGSSPETANRRAAAQAYFALGNPERAYGERTGVTQQGYDKIADTALEIEGAIMASQAMAVALRMHAAANDKDDLEKKIDEASKEARAIEDELEDVNREIILGKDLAAIGDEELKRGRDLRRRLRAAQDAEQGGLRSRMSPNAEQAMRIAANLERTDDQIDQLVGQGLDEVKSMLLQERKNLVEYKKLLAEYEQEARGVGSEVIGFSFKSVKDKLYDIVVRSDVGTVDVAWSQKEDSDDDSKRLNLARARDLKQLRDEFRFVLDDAMAPPTPRPQKTTLPPPSTEGSSPDKGKQDQRVNPAGDQTKTNTQPVVKPDNDKAAPAPAPKKTTTTTKKKGAKK